MALNDTPKGERIHIALFGKRNAGKSSIINAITNQHLAIVSDVAGTTTDPVYKAMELLPLGPVMIIDTPGLDDEGSLGRQRIAKTMGVLNKTDIAIVVFNIQDAIQIAKSSDGESPSYLSFERNIIKKIKEKGIRCICIWNKFDLWENALIKHPEYAKLEERILAPYGKLNISTETGQNIHELKELIATQAPCEETVPLVGDLLNPSDIVVLVTPIDLAAPKGRLILPQQQTIRDILDSDAMAIVTKEYKLKQTLQSLVKKPRLVITDSQVFSKVSADTPKDIPLTSFSILFARQKGDLNELVKGVRMVKELEDDDTILMAEGCTHHRQCDDIGTVKIPRWLLQNTGKKLIFEASSGTGYPEDLNNYSLIVHCGGCMLNCKEMQHRIKQAKEQNIPIVNYGILIAYMQGILERSLEPFPSLSEQAKQ